MRTAPLHGSLLVVALIASTACSHAPPPAEPAKAERRDEWLLALRSDIDRIAAEDGFEGQVRVLHAGKSEIDRTFGNPGCLPLGAGRRLLAAVSVAILVDGGKLDWDDRLERRLPVVAGTSFAPLTVGNLLTDSAGLAREAQKLDASTPAASGKAGASGAPAADVALEDRIAAAAKRPLQAPPGTVVDPGDERPWVLVERTVAQVSGEPFERFVEKRIAAPAGMTGTSLGPSAACPDAARGTTTLEDQLRLVDGLRSGKLVSPQTRAAMWEPRLPLGPGVDVGYGFFVRTHENHRAVGLGAEGLTTAHELWLDPASTDVLVLLGRTQARSARNIRTALGEFYALPPGPPHSSAPARRPPSR